MRIEKLGIDKRANIILGAGASRGASCFMDAWAQSPLDADFFGQLDRLKNLKEGKVLGDLAEFARSEFGVNHSLLMESFFTQLESLNEFYSSLKIDRGPRVRSYEFHLQRFPEYLAAIFRSLRAITPSFHCSHHQQLAKALRAGDTVISFNYDCIMDSALREISGKSWDASRGYGFNIQDGAEHWHDHSGRGRTASNSIQLLKVHGSLNWKRSAQNPAVIALREDAYEDGSRASNEVVPPVWNKRVSDDKVLSEIWKGARDSLRSGPVLVVIGYSVPETDLLSQVLLRVATSESGKNLSHLIMVNPDPRAHRKLKDVLRQALTTKSTVVELTSWSEFCELLPPRHQPTSAIVT